MSKPYDATSKDLIETDPAGWVAFLGGAVPPAAVGVIDADLSTVSTDADKVIRVDEPFRWLLHLDVQSGPDAALERRLLRYNALLHARHGVPVASAVVLLRRSANMTWLNGCLSVAPPVGPSWEFRYQVIRLWERPAAEFLNGPLGLVPLAPLAGVSDSELPAVVAGMRRRIDALPDRPLAAKLWAATYVLMGLQFNEAVIDNVLSGVLQMEESVTYQAILRRGMQDGIRQGIQQGIQQGIEQGRTMAREEEAEKVILRLGRKRFGPPSPEQEAALHAIKDLARLEAVIEKLLDAGTWAELLAGA